MKVKKTAGSICFAAGLIGVWQLAYVAGTEWTSAFKSYAVPNPLGVWNSLISLFEEGVLITAIGHSLYRVLIGFFAAVVLGTILGVLLLQSDYLYRNLRPLFLGAQTLPSVCWVPFAILWFGLSEGAIIFVVVMGASFGLALSVETGVKNVPPIYIKAAKTMGASPFTLYWKVILPAALPAFVGGLKQGWSFAWRALMSGEVMSASVGLGYTLMLGRDLADINQVMAVMLIIIAIGVVVDRGVFAMAENHLLRKRGLMEN